MADRACPSDELHAGLGQAILLLLAKTPYFQFYIPKQMQLSKHSTDWDAQVLGQGVNNKVKTGERMEKKKSLPFSIQVYNLYIYLYLFIRQVPYTIERPCVIYIFNFID